MAPEAVGVVAVRTDDDLSRVRRAVADRCRDLGFDELTRTRLVTATSELGRNLLRYAGSGRVEIDLVRRTGRIGLRVVFTDRGPGIADPQQALVDGFSTGEGLGLGLGGARRLVDQFTLDSEAESGTRVSVLCWRRP